MNLRRKIASLLAFVMAFSSVAIFSVAADAPQFAGIAPMSSPIDGEWTWTPATLNTAGAANAANWAWTPTAAMDQAAVDAAVATTTAPMGGLTHGLTPANIVNPTTLPTVTVDAVAANTAVALGFAPAANATLAVPQDPTGSEDVTFAGTWAITNQAALITAGAWNWAPLTAPGAGTVTAPTTPPSAPANVFATVSAVPAPGTVNTVTGSQPGWVVTSMPNAAGINRLVTLAGTGTSVFGQAGNALGFSQFVIPASIMGQTEGVRHQVNLSVAGLGDNALLAGWNNANTATPRNLNVSGFYSLATGDAIAMAANATFATNTMYRFSGAPAAGGNIAFLPFDFMFTGNNGVTIWFDAPQTGTVGAVVFPLALSVTDSQDRTQGTLNVTGGDQLTIAPLASYNITPVAVGQGEVNVSSGAHDAAARTGRDSASLAQITIAETSNLFQRTETVTGTFNNGTTYARGFRIYLQNDGLTFVPRTAAINLTAPGLAAAQWSLTNAGTLDAMAVGTGGVANTNGTYRFGTQDQNGRVGYVDIIFPNAAITRVAGMNGQLIIPAGTFEVRHMDPHNNPAFGTVSVNIQDLVWTRVAQTAAPATPANQGWDYRTGSGTNPVGGFNARPVNNATQNVAQLVESTVTFGMMSPGTGNAAANGQHRSNPENVTNVINPGFVRSLPASTTALEVLVAPSYTASSGQFAQSQINTAGVRIAQSGTEGLFWNRLQGQLTFSIVDAQGNLLEDVAIRGIWLGVGGNTTDPVTTARSGDATTAQTTAEQRTAWAQQMVWNQTADNRINNFPATLVTYTDGGGTWLPTTTSNLTVNFDSSAPVARVTGQMNHLVLNARFALAVGADFDGRDIYVQLDGPAGLMTELGSETTFRIATVEPTVEVSVEQTIVNVGFSNTFLNDIVISGINPRDLPTVGTPNNLVITLDVPGWARTNFAATGTNAQTQSLVNVSGGGSATVTATMNVVPNAGSPNLVLSVTRAANLGSNVQDATITISGVRVVDPFNDLAAGHIGLSFTGNVITNIDSEIINRADPASTTNFDILRPNQTGFKAWAQGPRAVSNALNVGGVGADGRPTTAGNTITVSWTAGPAFTINGNTTQFGAGQQSINLSAPATIHGVTVPHSTLFVPFRSVVAAMTNTHTETPLQGESVITFFEGSGDNPHSIVLEFGDNTAQFIIGQSTFVLNGLTLPMTNPATGAAVYTFIGDGTNGTVANVTYLPLRFIAAALGFDIADGVGQSIVTPR